MECNELLAEIKPLYLEFIEKYNKLNEILGFNNPIQIYKLFTFLYRNGYLSMNKVFNYNDSIYDNFVVTRSLSVFNGAACCRHLAVMLSDILNNMGMKSKYLVVGICDYEMANLKVGLEGKYSKEEILNWAMTYCTKEEYLQIKKIYDIEHLVCDDIVLEMRKRRFLEKIFGNHAITWVNKDGKNYFLDPTNKRIFLKNDNKKNMLYDYFIEIPYLFGIPYFANCFSLYKWNNVDPKCILNDKVTKKDMIDLMNNGTNMDLLEARIIEDNTLVLILKNMELFEKFYLDNKELYCELVNKYDKRLKLKK